MAVFTEEAVKANLRNRDGNRVFYLSPGDHLTPSAREWLRQERVEILSPERQTASRSLDGGSFEEKPEHMTHLRGGVLVRKDHPRIAFRGKLDTLEGKILLTIVAANRENRQTLAKDLEEVLGVLRQIMRCDVLEETLHVATICDLTLEQLREQSQHPQRYFDQPHFMPEAADGEMLLRLNELRAWIREAELAAYGAYHDREGLCTRIDILTVMNRLSSLIWILMIRMKKEGTHG